MRRGKKTSMGLTALMLVAAVGVAPGCDVEVEGDEGNFNFRYLESEREVASDLAVGARVDIEVRDAETESAVTLAQVYSEASDIVAVVDEQGRQFTLEARDSGRARIGADGVVDGEEVSDSFELRSAEVGSLALTDKCPDGVFVTNNRMRAGFRMGDGAGGGLTGYGHYPVSVEPAQGGRVNEAIRFLGALELVTGDEAGSFEIVADDGLEGAPLSFELIDAAAIDALELTENRAVLPVGQTDPVVVYELSAGGVTVCGPLDAAVALSTDDPEVCRAEAGLFFGELDVLSMHTVVVEGLSEGDCEVLLEVPEAGLSETFEVEVR